MSRLSSYDRPVHAVVVGGARGIGAAFVDHLLGESAVETLVATSRRPDSIAEGNSDSRLERLELDVTERSSLERLGSRLEKRDAAPNLVLVTAGWLHDAAEPGSDATEDDLGRGPEKKLADLDAEALGHAFRVNTIGPLLVVRAIAPLLPRSERSVVAALSARVGSIGDNGLGGWYGYRMSKSALNQGLHTAAIELKRQCQESVCVALHPGTVDTDLSRPYQSSVPEEKLFSRERAAGRLLDVLDGLAPEHTGGFFAWDGSSIPW